MGVKYDNILGKLRESDSTTSGSTYPEIFTWAGNPNGVVTPNAAGDEYIDSVTGHKWYAQTVADDTWVEINYLDN